MQGFELVYQNNIFIYRASLGVLAANCYLIASSESSNVVIVDPGGDGEIIYEFCMHHNWHVERILLTHGHYDHIGGSNVLREKCGCDVLIHEADALMLPNMHLNLSFYVGVAFETTDAEIKIKNEKPIHLNDLNITPIHTPGHTQGGICYYLDGVLISGDTLFKGNIGRTDFPKGNQNQLFHSIRSKLFELPDQTIVFPGHGLATTIGDEKRDQPYLWKN